MGSEIRFEIAGLRLKNPNNGSQGNSRLGGIIRAREKKKVRDAVKLHALAVIRRAGLHNAFARGDVIRVQILRIAPGTMDRWDGLPASCKGVVDGIASAFGEKVRDDDPRFEWLPPKQEKRGKGVYGVAVTIEACEPARIAGAR